ncbi:MAG: hypothetical protein HY791_19850 [Deltaproteobacteria bacterium]|nr:hypothetical protein [Deltaproteobacteria bacterium]
MTFALTVILAAASIIYELLLGQTLASTLGGTLVRYNVTIGLYLASMGLGALLVDQDSPNRVAKLVRIEVLLSMLGASAPVIALAVDRAVGSSGSRWVLEVAAHSLVVLIGVLSGFELPLLMSIGESEKVGRQNTILATDYFGTLLGAVAFPLLLLPGLGMFGVGIVVGLANAVAAMVLVFRSPRPMRLELGLLVALVAVFLTALSRLRELHELLVEGLYLAR